MRIFQEVLEEEEFREWPNVGIAIQGYLKSAGEDLASLAEWIKRRGTPIWFRLVKGAYWDYETVVAEQQGWPSPVWDRKPETDANFERQTRFLVEHHDLLRPAMRPTTFAASPMHWPWKRSFDCRHGLWNFNCFTAWRTKSSRRLLR